MVNEERIKKLFEELVSIDSESFKEKRIGEILKNKLEDIGLDIVTTDTTDGSYLGDHLNSYPNLYGLLRRNNGSSEKPILFSSHMDTVSPGIGKRAVIGDDGIIRSEGTTVLGADDVSGLVSIIEALTVIKEEGLSHQDIEVLFAVAEEPFCEGSKYLKKDLLKADIGYVLDLSGPVGRTAISAPSIISFEISVNGLAAHAGFEPEKGINAISIAVEALKEIRTGRLEEDLTVNVGTISGGTGKNIVPGNVYLTGEVRSTDPGKSRRKIVEIEKIFAEKADKARGSIHFNSIEHIRGYKVDGSNKVVKRFFESCNAIDLSPEAVVTYGGSDANRFNELGISTIVNACAMEKVHTTDEYTDVRELIRSAELTLKLMTL